MKHNLREAFRQWAPKVPVIVLEDKIKLAVMHGPPATSAK